MPPASDSQRDKLLNLFDGRSMMRAQELRETGISPQTIARAVETGEIKRSSRGVYQSGDPRSRKTRSSPRPQFASPRALSLLYRRSPFTA